MRFLTHLAAQLPSSSTLGDLLKDVVIASTYTQGCRFTELHTGGPPTYFVQQRWQRSFLELITIIGRHVSDMEPDRTPDEVYIWLDILSTSPHSEDQLKIDMAAMKGTLTKARPTLVCMEAGSGSGSGGASLDGSSHCLAVMHRSREGIPGGFAGLRFDTVNVLFT